MSLVEQNLGFDGRVFLDEAEWLTYRRRRPVRYIRTPPAASCKVCGEPETSDNPLQNVHLIGFEIGVIDLALTPDFLDSGKNIVTAHQRKCNKASKLDLQGSMDLLRELGVKELPQYLPAVIQEAWRKATDN